MKNSSVVRHETEYEDIIYDDPDDCINDGSHEESHKNTLEIVYECYTKFPTLINGQWRFTKEHFTSLGKNIEDAEEELGFPRGWSEVSGYNEDTRWFYLRMQADGCDIQEQFEEWLCKRVPHPDDEKEDIVAALTKAFTDDYDVLTIDGARVNFGDGWALVRSSNTSANLTIRFEANTQERLKEIQTIVYRCLDASSLAPQLKKRELHEK